jgi:hypothetical protein
MSAADGEDWRIKSKGPRVSGFEDSSIEVAIQFLSFKAFKRILGIQGIFMEIFSLL